MASLDDDFHRLENFKQGSLHNRIANLEKSLRALDKTAIEEFAGTQDVDPTLFASALTVKRAASQINEVVHAVGILLLLPHILQPGEVIEALSLAAGNTGKPFDLETNMRIAEFKFIDWKGGPEAIRQNQLFKDFYLLAEYLTNRDRYLYVVGTEHPKRFLNSQRSLRSVMSRDNKLWSDFQTKYRDRFSTVRDYFIYREARVKIEDMATIIPYLGDGLDEDSNSTIEV